MRSTHHLEDDRYGERGAAVVELALVIPLMLLLLLVVFDFGRGFLAFVTVTDGARDAARVAMQDDKSCIVGDLLATAQNSSSPYAINLAVTEDPVSGQCAVTVSHQYTPVLPFVTGSFSLPMIGQVGPLWDGMLSETMVSK